MKKITTFQLVVTAMFAAILCVLGPLTIPIGPIPISLITLIIYFIGYILGPRFGTLSTLVYVMLGLAGLPVLAGGTGGIAKLFGPTGGFLVGYIVLALIVGLFAVLFKGRKLFVLLGMVVGTVVLYALGVAWFMIGMQATFAAAMTSCVLPFLVGDAIKIAAAMLLGIPVRAALVKAGFLKPYGAGRETEPAKQEPTA